MILADFLTPISKVFLYWVAFVLTHPLGATFGDHLTKPVLKGGINLGSAGSSLVLIPLLAATVVYITWLEKRGLRTATSLERENGRGVIPVARADVPWVPSQRIVGPPQWTSDWVDSLRISGIIHRISMYPKWRHPCQLIGNW